ncbi:hypothetical protein BJY52DRAFT_952269 [Lactarius psammicola]|nr:hypothetical protein BJY52DRAFT_952269 [Lactarius psammicola]
MPSDLREHESRCDDFNSETKRRRGPRAHHGYAAPARTAASRVPAFNEIRTVTCPQTTTTQHRQTEARPMPVRTRTDRPVSRAAGPSSRVGSLKAGAQPRPVSVPSLRFCAPRTPLLRAHVERGFCPCPATHSIRPHSTGQIRRIRDTRGSGGGRTEYGTLRVSNAPRVAVPETLQTRRRPSDPKGDPGHGPDGTSRGGLALLAAGKLWTHIVLCLHDPHQRGRIAGSRVSAYVPTVLALSYSHSCVAYAAWAPLPFQRHPSSPFSQTSVLPHRGTDRVGLSMLNVYITYDRH